MNRLAWAVLGSCLATGCSAHVFTAPTGPLCGTCDLGSPAARRAAKIVVTEDPALVSGCTFMGTVGGWEDLDKQNQAYALAVSRHAYDRGADPVIRVLFRSGSDDEAYLCPSGPASETRASR